MDIIFLHELKVDAVIGIWDWERKIRQTVVIDLEMATDIRKAAATDSVDDTLNYKLVAKRGSLGPRSCEQAGRDSWRKGRRRDHRAR
jgi:FolB domain-containing protein